MTISNSEHELFKSLVEASPTPAAIYVGADIEISAANDLMLNFWGKDASVIGKPIAEALPVPSSQHLVELVRQVYTSGTTYHAREEKTDLLIDHQIRSFYFSITIKAIKNGAGVPTGIIHTQTDITELVLARQKIAETEEHLAFALSSAGIGTWDLAPLNNTIKWDARCRELFGFAKDGNVTYQEVLNCIHPDDESFVRKAVEKAITPGNEGHYDIRYRTVSQDHQQIRWLHCKGKAYFNEKKIAYRFAGTAQDISEEVKTRTREQRLLCLVEHNVDHMSVADMEGNLIYINDAGKKILGIDPDMDITTLSANDFYTPSELKRVQENLIRQIHERTGWQGVIRLMNRITKEEIPCQVNYILIKDVETGKVIGRGATARDLRPEIKAKAELQRLGMIVDISEDFINYCDISGNTIYLNDAGLKLIGMDKSRMSSSNLYDYHSEASVIAISDVIMPQLLSKGKWSGPLELVHQQTGEIIPIHKQLFIIREDITDTPIAIAGIARDLRPELKAGKVIDFKNTQLHIAIRELEFLANSVPVVVWTSNPRGQFDYINQRWYERSPISISKALGDGWTEILHPDDAARTRAAWHECLKTSDPFRIEFRMLDKYGDYRWWMVRAIALKDDNDNIIKWYGSNIDITDHKELERQKDNFLGVASHELKTPVTSIKAYAQVMEMMFRRAGDTKNAELLGKMDNQINRLNNLIGDLLEVTKINTGRLQFVISPFNFNQMVEDVIEEVQRTSLKHKIQKELRFEGEVTGDRERIFQVITNLLTNAIKYSPDASRIIIYTERNENEVQLCVQDFGIGIRRDQQDRIFEQFYRVSGSREHTFPGLGLGLYISSEIVKHLNGRIWVNSVEGKGSTFCFALPLQ
ncbi:PAS domain S-box protein [Pedobacter hartonius]|uniref:histidine kinase n=1 Tax=Pedobacter hartonius TaxID=425514 RepID=A0A1H4H9E6_9SPHI|nr:PAS domain S-box protein [Pedobacter hartonius]SEB18251.1 PAS domain S-box-containing protein [Pedobacter hartonius]